MDKKDGMNDVRQITVVRIPEENEKKKMMGAIITEHPT